MKNFLKRLAALIVAGGFAADARHRRPCRRQDHSHRLPEIRHAGAAQGAGHCSRRGSGRWAGPSTWTEFPGGPQLLEALNVGAIDFGTTGEAPPIFAQAAGAPLRLCRPRAAGAERRGDPGAEGLPDHRPSPTSRARRSRSTRARTSTTCWCRRSRRPASDYGDIKTGRSCRRPTRARPSRRAPSMPGRSGIRSWPRPRRRPARASSPTAPGSSATISSTSRRRRSPTPTRTSSRSLLDDLGEVDRWVEANRRRSPPSSRRRSAFRRRCSKSPWRRQAYGVKPIDDDVVAEQQKIADTFLALGLIPKPIKIADAVWKAAVMTPATSPAADVLWFLPTHGDGRYLGTTNGGRAIDLALPAPDRRRRPIDSATTACCCRPARAARIPGSSPRRWRRSTEQLRFLVAVRPGLQPPTVAARMTATLDRISNGRLLINVVTGGDPVENKGDGIFLEPRRALRGHPRIPATSTRRCSPARRSTSTASISGSRAGSCCSRRCSSRIRRSISAARRRRRSRSRPSTIDKYLTWGEPPGRGRREDRASSQAAGGKARPQASLRHPPARHRARDRATKPGRRPTS